MALDVMTYLNTTARIRLEEIIITNHAVDRYYEQIHLDGKRQNWKNMPPQKLAEIRNSLKWERCRVKIRQLLSEASWREPAHWRARIQATERHGCETFIFKRFRCLFKVVQDKSNPKTFVLVTLRFMQRSE